MTIVPDLFWNPVDIIRAHCVDVRHQRRARWQVSDFVINEMTRHFQRDVLKKESDIPTDKAEDVANILAQAFVASYRLHPITSELATNCQTLLHTRFGGTNHGQGAGI